MGESQNQAAPAGEPLYGCAERRTETTAFDRSTTPEAARKAHEKDTKNARANQSKTVLANNENQGRWDKNNDLQSGTFD